MSNTSLLYQYWSKWETKLRKLVYARGARLTFPNMVQRQGAHDDNDPDIRTFELTRPICILDAPQKASTKRSTKKMHILIDGTFKFREAGGHPCLLHASCNVTLFDPIENDDNDTLEVNLIDALHFDVESPDAAGKHKAFHPFFHAQRGINNRHTDALVQSIFAEATAREGHEVVVNQDAKDRIGHPYIRIPTPQLDLFAVMAMIAADCFCNPANAEAADQDKVAQPGEETRAEVLFVDLLQLLTESSNIVREGDTSRALTKRVTSSNLMSAGHWYPEWA